MTGHLYLIGYQSADCYRIKIGIAKDVDRRIRQLQTGCPQKLYLLKAISVAAPRHIEQRLHQKYRHYRIERGEWFKLPEVAVQDLLNTIDRLESAVG